MYTHSSEYHQGSTSDRPEPFSSNYYERLGIKSDASEKDIQNAYYKIAKEYDPDKNGGNGNPEIFRFATEAYEILNNPGKKDTYDRKIKGEKIWEKVNKSFYDLDKSNIESIQRQLDLYRSDDIKNLSPEKRDVTIFQQINCEIALSKCYIYSHKEDFLECPKDDLLKHKVLSNISSAELSLKYAKEILDIVVKYQTDQRYDHDIQDLQREINSFSEYLYRIKNLIATDRQVEFFDVLIIKEELMTLSALEKELKNLLKGKSEEETMARMEKFFKAFNPHDDVWGDLKEESNRKYLLLLFNSEYAALSKPIYNGKGRLELIEDIEKLIQERNLSQEERNVIYSSFEFIDKIFFTRDDDTRFLKAYANAMQEVIKLLDSRLESSSSNMYTHDGRKLERATGPVSFIMDDDTRRMLSQCSIKISGRTIIFADSSEMSLDNYLEHPNKSIELSHIPRTKNIRLIVEEYDGRILEYVIRNGIFDESSKRIIS